MNQFVDTLLSMLFPLQRARTKAANGQAALSQTTIELAPDALRAIVGGDAGPRGGWMV